MSFKVFLEAITVPHYLPHIFWKETVKKSKELEAIFVNKHEFISETDEKISEELGPRYVMDNVYTSMPRKIRAGQFLISQRMEEYSEFSKMKSMSLNTLSKMSSDLALLYDKEEYLKFQTSYLEFINVDYKKLIQKEEQNEVQIPEIHECRKMFKAMYKYLQLAKDLQKHIQAEHKRVEIHNQKYVDGSDLSPDHKEIEVLYHATPFVKEIIANGFKLKEELGNINVVGGETEGAISFTADIKIAKAIVDCIREAIRIAKGEFTLGQIIQIIKKEKLMNNRLVTDWIQDMKYRAKQMKKQKRIAEEGPTDTEKMFNDYHMYEIPEIRKVTFELYTKYLAVANARYNPAFFGVTWKTFENMDVNNTGILACKVDMKQNVRYLSSMEEFRIKKEGILSVKRVNY